MDHTAASLTEITLRNSKSQLAIPVKFAKDSTGFIDELDRRVDKYFKDRGISRRGDWRMITKTVLVLGLYVSSCVLAVFGGLPPGLTLLCAVLFGASMALIAFNIGHDAAHGSYSESGAVNRILSYSLNLIGVNRYIWNIKHNLSHHSFTNIPWADMDNENIAMARLTRHHRPRAIYRYQHLYLPVLWLFFSLYLTLVKDFQLFSMKRMGNNRFIKHPASEWVILIISKIFFILVTLVMPFLFMNYPWWQILAGIFIMHACTGILLASIFFFVHLLDDSPFPEEDSEGRIHRHWYIHQIEVTCDFAPENKVLAWLAGGLNQHVVHHLYPDVCHVHYYDVTRIIRETAAEYGVRYRSKGFLEAFRSHMSFLKKMGEYNKPAPVFGYDL